MALVVCKPVEHPVPTKLWGTPRGVGWGARRGWDPPTTSLASTPYPNWGPSNVFLLYKNQVQVVASSSFRKLLYFLELLIVNLKS